MASKTLTDAEREQRRAQERELKARKASTHTERFIERRDLDEAMATERGDAAQIRAAEITGYGSSARWNTRALRSEVLR